MSLYNEELVGKEKMVTNVELYKEMKEKKERNRLLEEALEEMKKKFEDFFEATSRWTRKEKLLIKVRKILMSKTSYLSQTLH